MECSICFESLKTGIIKTDCKHTFHKLCLDKWIDFNNNCPLCRSIINRKQKDRYKIIEIYSGNYFEGEIIEQRFTDSGNICYTITNINNSKYPIGKLVYSYSNLIVIEKI